MGRTSSSSQTIEEKKFEFGRDSLGPAIAGYLQKLEQTCWYFSEVHDAKILFCARAGVRIRHALDVFMARKGESVPEAWEHFWVSRMMIAKGIWSISPRSSAEIFDKEFRHTPIGLADDCITGKMKTRKGSKDWRQSRKPTGVGKALSNKSARMKNSIAHLSKQSDLFLENTRKLIGEHKAVLLVDTGWMGSSQKLLESGLPEIEWYGAYFGLSANEQEKESRAHWSRAMGLVFQADKVDPDKPETCVVAHRHMIEDLFEPAGPSIEAYEASEDGEINAVGARENLADTDKAAAEDPIFAGVLDYLERAPKDPAAVLAAANRAWLKLQKFVLTPTREDTAIYRESSRSADFGKPYSAPILLEKGEGKDADERISLALWRSGQIAIEYEDGMADAVQRKQFGMSYGHEPAAKLTVRPATEVPKVAVITRTMDRPMFLRRALLSVHNQTFRDYVHVVVSDGGDLDFVRKAIEDANIDHSRVLLVDNIKNRGMEAASNIAINASDSEFVVIHDDDDTWAPTFLQETVDYLESKEGQKYGGVITESIYVSESVHPNGIKVHHARPYLPRLPIPTFHSMMQGNTFAPISFLFRRSVYNEIGPFREDYPVLGDWDFNLRFLERYDIAVLPKALANYHHRDTGDIETFGNSVVAGVDKHVKQLPIMRNDYLRRASKGGVEAAAAASLNITVDR